MNKTILITGATSGIGKATAYRFAQEGYRCILVARRTELLNEIKQDLESKYGTSCSIYIIDLTNTDQIKSITNDILKNNQIDILFNNAGLARGLDEFHEANLEHWDTMLDTNVRGLYHISRYVSEQMVSREAGHIINTCSTAGHEVYPRGNVYCASKHAVDALTKAMRIDLHKYGIKVSQISPAHVEETQFAKVRFDGDAQKAKIYEDFNPLKSSDVAETVYFIATQPAHVNIQDVLMMGTQQANSTTIFRSGRQFD